MGYSSNRVFLTLATVLGFSLLMGLAVLVIVVRTADVLPTPTAAVIVVAAVTDWLTEPPATNTPTITPSPQITAAPCAWSWAREDLPEVTEATQAAIDAAGIMHTTVRTEAYGESCGAGFSAMTTDFYFTSEVEAANLDNGAALAAFVKPLYNIAAALPRDAIPAPPGYLDLTFTSSEGAVRLRTRFDDVQNAIERNLKGVALLDALGGLDSISG